MSSLDKLQAAIKKAGFDAFAIMPAKPLTKMESILKQAKAENRYPAFVTDDIEKRINPSALQESALSIISLAVSYNTGHPGPTPPLHGTVSRSAWGQDYHHVLEERMDKVIHFLKKYFGAKECSKAVDTSFLIDRALAIESGLGFPGDNCAVYVPPFGSWVFLGEILVDIKLPSTKEAGQNNWKHPIQCKNCIKACPTGALFAPGKINPHICLSYLTQKSGSIPEALRDKFGFQLWGCDRCQQACPINQKAPLTSHKEFEPIIGPHVPLIPLLAMDNKEFEETFGPTSMSWRGKNILQRNACIVLGNHKDPQALPTLEQVANYHPSPIVQEAAHWAIKKIEQHA